MELSTFPLPLDLFKQLSAMLFGGQKGWDWVLAFMIHARELKRGGSWLG
jgi:hypothetical protein